MKHPVGMLVALAVLSAGMAHGRTAASPVALRPKGELITGWKWTKASGVTATTDPKTLTPPMLDDGWKKAAPGENIFKYGTFRAWYRTDLPAIEGSDPRMFVTRVDDGGSFWLNGVYLGTHANYKEPYDLVLGRAWKKAGPNEMAVLVGNAGGGPGGIAAAVIHDGNPVYATAADEPVTVIVDPDVVVRKVPERFVGLNTCFWFEADRLRPPGARSGAEAMREMGVKVLRYPGGVESDIVRWAVPPYENPRPFPARWGEKGWPWDVAQVHSPDGTFAPGIMDFAEFTKLAESVGADATLVVNCQSWRNPGRARRAPTRDELLEDARAWVRLVKKNKSPWVRLWEIGNEVSLHNNMGEAAAYSATEYARDVVDFSRAIKSVDPDARVGAGVDWSATRLGELLRTAAPDLDVIISHAYYQPPSYEEYRSRGTTESGMIWETRMIADAIAALPTPDRDRIRIAVTEYGARNFEHSWPETNDLGHAVAVFDMLGQFLCEPAVEFACHWVSRWFDSDNFSATSLTKDNALTPVGRAVAIWGESVREKMVRASCGDPQVLPFATRDPKTGGVVVLVANKDTTSRRATVSVSRKGRGAPKVRQLRGWGPEDPAPAWGPVDPPVREKGGWRIDLPPVSITVLTFK